MKSLAESLFDKNLASKDTGVEYLYGLVDYAAVYSSCYIDYLNVKKIKHDFNELTKKFEMKAWNNNKFLAMDKFQKMETNELLRELLYIIVTKIPSPDSTNLSRLKKSIENIIKDYADLNNENVLEVYTSDNYSHITVYIKFCNRQTLTDGVRITGLGRIEIQLRPL